MSLATVGSSDKALALDVLQRMPEMATLEQISDELALMAALRRGIADADAGRVISHKDLTERSATWITK